MAPYIDIDYHSRQLSGAAADRQGQSCVKATHVVVHISVIIDVNITVPPYSASSALDCICPQRAHAGLIHDLPFLPISAIESRMS